MTSPENARNMGRSRRLMVTALSLGVVVLSLFVIAIDREYWPMSQYPMYSRLRQEVFWNWKLYGISPRGEVALDAREYWYPFGGIHLSMALDRLAGVGDPAKLESATRKLLTDYETRRAVGQHGGPPILGLRIYRVGWVLRPRAENRHRPDRLQLVHELRLDPR